MRSLRLKLIVGSLLVLAAVILGFDAFFLLAKRSALLDIMDGRLYSAAQALEKRLEIKDGKPAFDPDDESGSAATKAASRPIRILDEAGRVLYESDHSLNAPWPATPRDTAAPYWKTVRSGRGRAWRTLTWVDRFEIDADSAGKEASGREATTAVTIQCAEPLAEMREELRELGSLLALLSLAAFLIAGGGSFVLAGRALRPIRRINDALARVSASRLDGRIDAAGFDRELRPLIGQINAALDRLETSFRRERQFTADASHELRTPLAAILSSIEVLLRRPRGETELVEAHRDNWRTARSMQAIIEGLLLLARMDADKSLPAKETIDLPGLVDDLLASFAARAASGSVRLEPAVEPGLRMAADPAQLRLALSNLIDNAIRYNRPGGTVVVSARRTDGGTAIEVRDTGIGIPPTDLPRVFERFFRVDPSRTEATGGCGLGLSIVQKIVDAHGGRITAASSPAGSLFTIVLPGA